MSRKLYISDDISIDEALAEIADKDPMLALLWPWLLVHLDDWGRSSASPRRLKGAIAPMIEAVSADTIEAALNAYAAKHLIALYEVEGQRYLAVNPEKWWRYQTHIHKSKREDDRSSIPPPPAEAFTYSAESRGVPRSPAENRASPPPSTLLPPPTAPRDSAEQAAAVENFKEERSGTGPAADISTREQQRIAIAAEMRTIPGWHANDGQDLQEVSRLWERCPGVDLMAVIADVRAHALDGDLKAKPRIAIRRFADHAYEQLKRSAPPRPRPREPEPPPDCDQAEMARKAREFVTGLAQEKATVRA